MKTLIVTADDFGLSLEVNEAVEAAHRQGVLQAASLMVGAPAAGDAVARARALPSLRVGLHLTLVDGPPTLPAQAIPALVDARGALRGDLVGASIALFFGPRARRQMRREVIAQFEAFRATGLPLDHVNAHKHFHLHPTVAAAVIEIGRRFGMRALRVPHEPADVLARVDGAPVPPSQASRGPWAAWLRRRIATAGLITTDRCFGETWSGAVSEERLCRLVQALPAGSTEIYCHPASANSFPGAAGGFDYRGELRALQSPRVAAAVRAADLRLAAFSDLPARA